MALLAGEVEDLGLSLSPYGDTVAHIVQAGRLARVGGRGCSFVRRVIDMVAIR